MRLGEFLAECGLLFKQRNGVYKNAWEKMTPIELACGLRLKAARIMTMLEVDGDVEKVLDDLKDLVNYAGMLYMKLNGG